MRAASRHRAAFEADQAHRVASGELGRSVVLGAATPFTWWSNFSRFLLKGYEHTWGPSRTRAHRPARVHPALVHTLPSGVA